MGAILLTTVGCINEELEPEIPDYSYQNYMLNSFQEFESGTQFYVMQRNDGDKFLAVKKNNEVAIINENNNNFRPYATTHFYALKDGEYLASLDNHYWKISENIAGTQDKASEVPALSNTLYSGKDHQRNSIAFRRSNGNYVEFLFYEDDNSNWVVSNIPGNYNGRTIAVDPTGDGYWVGNYALSHYTSSGEEEIFVGLDKIEKIVFDKQNNLWAIAGRSLYQYDGSTLKEYNSSNSNIAPYQLRDIAINSNNLLFLRSMDFVFTYNPSTDVLQPLSVYGTLVIDPDIQNDYLKGYEYLYKVNGNNTEIQELP